MISLRAIFILIPIICLGSGFHRPRTVETLFSMNYNRAIVLTGHVEKVEFLNNNSKLTYYEKTRYRFNNNRNTLRYVMIRYYIRPDRGSIVPFGNYTPVVVTFPYFFAEFDNVKKINKDILVSGQEIILITDNWEFMPREDSIEITVNLSKIRRGGLLFKKVEDGGLTNSEQKPFINSFSPNENVRYWQYLYLLSDKSEIKELDTLLKDLISMRIFQEKREGKERYKKLIDENFPEISSSKKRRLYRKHHYKPQFEFPYFPSKSR